MGLLAWTAAVRAQCSQDKIVLDLSFEGNVTDGSNYANTVTAVGNPGYGVGYDATPNGAIQLSSGKYLTIPPVAAFEAMTDGFTISAWVYPTAFGTYNSVVTKLNFSHRNIDMRVHSDGRVQVHFTNSSNGISAMTSDNPVVSTNSWTHLAATWDGSVMKLFVNGAQVKESTFTDGPVFQSMGAISIGALNGSEPFIGSLDNVVLRTYAVDSGDVQCLMSEAAPSAQGIVLDMPLDNSGADVSANANDGNVYSVGVGTDRWGQNTKAMNFAFASNRIIVPHISAYDDLDNGFTISAWINPSSVTGIHTVVGKANSGRDIVIRVHDGKLTAHYYVGGYVWCSAPTATVVANEWSHVACTWDGNDMSIYHNGELLQSIEPSGALPSFTTAAWSLGSLTSSGSEFYEGLMDEFKVWDRALTSCELRSTIQAYQNLLAPETLFLCEGQSTTLSALDGFCTYNWVNDGSSGTSFVVDASDFTVGDHQIVLEAYDYYDQLYTDTVELSVSLCTGINESANENTMILYPNPATHVVTVNANGLTDIRLLDVSGRLLMQVPTNGTQTDIDVSGIPAGVYFVQGLTEDGAMFSERLMKH